jgi:very-short-patch-repair endonuclease
LDFYCPALRLAIEVDGGQHAETARRDSERDEWLQGHGVTVLRFWNSDVTANRAGVLDTIAGKVSELKARQGDPYPALARRPPPFRGRYTE